jgi:arginase family enzyme
MVDSHADINLRATSPTGNIHGMWLRPVVDHFDVVELDQLIEHKVPADQLFYIGNLDLDPAEKEFIAQRHVGHYSVEYLRADLEKAQQLFSEWCCN